MWSSNMVAAESVALTDPLTAQHWDWSRVSIHPQSMVRTDTMLEWFSPHHNK